MRSKELAEELRDWAGARQIWTRLEKESAPFIVSKSSAVSIIIIWKRFGSTRTLLTAGCLNTLKSRGRRVSVREVTKKPKLTLTLTPQIPTGGGESFRPATTAAAWHHNWAVEQSGRFLWENNVKGNIGTSRPHWEDSQALCSPRRIFQRALCTDTTEMNDAWRCHRKQSSELIQVRFWLLFVFITLWTSLKFCLGCPECRFVREGKCCFVFYSLFWYEKKCLRNGEKLKRLWVVSGPTVCFSVHLHATCLDKAVHSSKCKCLHKRGWIPIWFHSTHSLFLDPLGESLPGAVITHSFLFSLHSIGMATLEEPHSYTFPMLVIGLSHVAAARSPPTTSVCFIPLRLYYSFTLAECTHANGGSKGAVTSTRLSSFKQTSFR